MVRASPTLDEPSYAANHYGNQNNPNYYGANAESYTPANFPKNCTGASELPLARSEGNPAGQQAHADDNCHDHRMIGEAEPARRGGW